MSDINTGGTAFPVVIDLGQGVEWSKGMTLRDYFAAKAMNALATYEEYPPERAAKYAYEYADAMLKAREAK